MRMIAATSVFLATVCLAVAQQLSTALPTVSGVLDRMKSASWSERCSAFGEATELLAPGKASPSDAGRVRIGIIQLLINENNGGLKEPEATQPTSPNAGSAEKPTDEGYGEGYGEDKSEYYAGLIGFVADLNDERAIPALLGAAGTGGMATRAVARFGKKAIDPTLAQVKSQDSDRASGALFVIRQMLKMRTISDPDSHIRIKNILRSTLASPEYRLRENAMSAIEYLDDREEFVPTLQDIAEHDTYKSAYSSGNGENGKDAQYLVRRRAQLLLGKISNREQPAVDRGVSH
jgi:hypothetical protein